MRTIQIIIGILGYSIGVLGVILGLMYAPTTAGLLYLIIGGLGGPLVASAVLSTRSDSNRQPSGIHWE